ncbi:hypothetical protein PAAG_09106 [Paracoccidioides lutzii Pb01]|uniref:Uncharacterized protein n=1 Tax=Paracoccidioides lutzii (strain ATCC MYA-826 / Pb01) TaxID=502779 RepID=C1HEB5_PARBA|nr:hypothetical protein PAAG_09106 [Paracoccidioides lutzii Pb01]EEH41395.2 hypothetical protein PAAG_09106 [Paracoccidioides lutzii Pb01]
MEEIHSQLNLLKEVKKPAQAANSSANVAQTENTAAVNLNSISEEWRITNIVRIEKYNNKKSSESKKTLSTANDSSEMFQMMNLVQVIEVPVYSAESITNPLII